MINKFITLWKTKIIMQYAMILIILSFSAGFVTALLINEIFQYIKG